MRQLFGRGNAELERLRESARCVGKREPQIFGDLAAPGLGQNAWRDTSGGIVGSE
jgi:hypothetical protein